MNEEQDRVDRLVRSLLSVDPSIEFESRIRKRIVNEKHTRRTAARSVALGSGIAAAIVIGLLLTNAPAHEPGLVESPPVIVHVAEETPAPVIVDSLRSMPSSPALERIPEKKVVAVAVEPAERGVSSAVIDDFFVLSPLEGLSLETAPLKTAALAPDELPQFRIQPLSLLDSNKGVAE